MSNPSPLDLQNEHNVYILGAGFSRDANMPLISDFLVRMRDSHPWLAAQDRTAEANSVQEVLRFRLSAASAAYWTQLDLENIEELFSLAASNSGGLTEHIQRAIAATLDYCAQETARRPVRMTIEKMPWAKNAAWLKSSSGGPEYYEIDPYAHYAAKLLGMFRDGRPVGRNTFITFNYDTILEDALDMLKVSYGYSFPKQSANWDPSMKASSGINPDTKILKLHGSVNWGMKKQKGRRFTVFGHYADLLKSAEVPELIPPTWRKIFQDQLTYIWESAVTSLQSATRVVVIGFSIPPTDTHFKYLLAAGLQGNVSLREIHFCGRSDSIDELKNRAATLLRKSYMDRGIISFSGEELSGMCNDGRRLAELGRPIWKQGDVGIMQTG